MTTTDSIDLDQYHNELTSSNAGQSLKYRLNSNIATKVEQAKDFVKAAINDDTINDEYSLFILRRLVNWSLDSNGSSLARLLRSKFLMDIYTGLIDEVYGPYCDLDIKREYELLLRQLFVSAPTSREKWRATWFTRVVSRYLSIVVTIRIKLKRRQRKTYIQVVTSQLINILAVPLELWPTSSVDQGQRKKPLIQVIDSDDEHDDDQDRPVNGHDVDEFFNEEWIANLIELLDNEAISGGLVALLLQEYQNTMSLSASEQSATRTSWSTYILSDITITIDGRVDSIATTSFPIYG
ncbi:hypothetical protein BDF22DRAFT_656161 [Syncephalis plumigaleata]|nr:hypothetical protein BDF22DRAFT_656161 [Syncephalis plumigaleata]